MTKIVIEDLIKELEKGQIHIPQSNSLSAALKATKSDISKIMGVPKSHMTSPVNTNVDYTIQRKPPMSNDWRPHPKWNRLYYVTDKKTGLGYFCALVWKEGTTKVLIKKTHESILIPFKSATESYTIQNIDDKLYELQGPVENFIRENMWNVDSYVNSQILKRK